MNCSFCSSYSYTVHAVCAGELIGVRDDGVEHGLEVERRAEGLADVAQRLQLADRPRELAGTRLQLLEEPDVLDRDHGLVGEGLQQIDLLAGERPGL